MTMWCEPLNIEINSTAVCELWRRNRNLKVCDGCAGPIEKIMGHNNPPHPSLPAWLRSLPRGERKYKEKKNVFFQHDARNGNN